MSCAANSKNWKLKSICWSTNWPNNGICVVENLETCIYTYKLYIYICVCVFLYLYFSLCVYLVSIYIYIYININCFFHLFPGVYQPQGLYIGLRESNQILFLSSYASA